MVRTTLTDSVQRILAKLLVDLGLGVAPTLGNSPPWSVYHSKEPARPDNVLTVYRTDGRPQGRDAHTGEQWELVGFQVRVRGNDSEAATLKADQVVSTLESTAEVYDRVVYLDGRSYKIHSVDQTSGPLPLGTEDAQRTVLTVNAVASIRQLT